MMRQAEWRHISGRGTAGAARQAAQGNSCQFAARFTIAARGRPVERLLRWYSVPLRRRAAMPWEDYQL